MPYKYIWPQVFMKIIAEMAVLISMHQCDYDSHDTVNIVTLIELKIAYTYLLDRMCESTLLIYDAKQISSSPLFKSHTGLRDSSATL